MADFDNTNRFVLFKNKDKRDDKDRDYNGTVKPKEAPQQSISERAMPKRPDPISSGRPRVNADMDDDIPFSPEFR